VQTSFNCSMQDPTMPQFDLYIAGQKDPRRRCAPPGDSKHRSMPVGLKALFPRTTVNIRCIDADEVTRYTMLWFISFLVQSSNVLKPVFSFFSSQHTSRVISLIVLADKIHVRSLFALIPHCIILLEYQTCFVQVFSHDIQLVGYEDKR
jgi:hypothetical protein